MRASTIWLTALLVLAGVAPLAGEETRTLTRAFPVAEGQTLRLANLAGSVRLAAGSGSEVRVEATLHAQGRNAAETRRLLDALGWVEGRDAKGRKEWALSYPVAEYRGFHYPGSKDPEGAEAGFWERLFQSLGGHTNTRYLGERVRVSGSRSAATPTLYADLKITFPAAGALVVRNVVGPVRGRQLAGDLTVDTGSGGVKLESFAGRLVVDTGSGAIAVDDLRGERAHLDTGSGDITVQDGSADRLRADTGSGDIEVLDVEVVRFEADTGSGSVTLWSSLARAEEVLVDTGSGDVQIVAGPDASFDLAADLGSGDVTVGFADATLRKSGREVVGARRGDGRTRIRVDTGSGDCEIGPR